MKYIETDDQYHRINRNNELKNYQREGSIDLRSSKQTQTPSDPTYYHNYNNEYDHVKQHIQTRETDMRPVKPDPSIPSSPNYGNRLAHR